MRGELRRVVWSAALTIAFVSAGCLLSDPGAREEVALSLFVDARLNGAGFAIGPSNGSDNRTTTYQAFEVDEDRKRVWVPNMPESGNATLAVRVEQGDVTYLLVSSTPSALFRFDGTNTTFLFVKEPAGVRLHHLVSEPPPQTCTATLEGAHPQERAAPWVANWTAPQLTAVFDRSGEDADDAGACPVGTLEATKGTGWVLGEGPP